jgi:transposase
MQEAHNLKQLNHEEKDAIIIAQGRQIEQLMAEVRSLQEQVKELQAKLSINSRNSNKPPSSDGLNKRAPKSLRQSGQRPSGGQKGHPGITLRQVEEADAVITHHVPEVCEVCQRELKPTLCKSVRQVFDLPEPRVRVTEHRAEEAVCCCGRQYMGQFPSEVRKAVQYGPVTQAMMVHLSHQHMLPLRRRAKLMGEMLGLPVSEATVQQACINAARRLNSTLEAIARTIQNSAVVHADETGLRVNKKLHWMHVATTEKLTWMAIHPQRGTPAFKDLGVLPQFKGVLIHDGWSPYRRLDCQHGLCNAHHLRELTYLHEELGQDWAGEMIELLVYANNQVKQHSLIPKKVTDLRVVFDTLLEVGDQINPRNPSAQGKRGRIKQSKALNLIDRLRLYSDDVWRFATNPLVPFTNNSAEQAIRMPKVKQKISGCFRTQMGADIFCTIRSYLATMYKQGANLFHCLVKVFQGSVPLPAGVGG